MVCGILAFDHSKRVLTLIISVIGIQRGVPIVPGHLNPLTIFFVFKNYFIFYGYSLSLEKRSYQWDLLEIPIHTHHPPPFERQDTRMGVLNQWGLHHYTCFHQLPYMGTGVL